MALRRKKPLNLKDHISVIRQWAKKNEKRQNFSKLPSRLKKAFNFILKHCSQLKIQFKQFYRLRHDAKGRSENEFDSRPEPKRGEYERFDHQNFLVGYYSDSPEICIEETKEKISDKAKQCLIGFCELNPDYELKLAHLHAEAVDGKSVMSDPDYPIIQDFFMDIFKKSVNEDEWVGSICRALAKHLSDKSYNGINYPSRKELENGALECNFAIFGSPIKEKRFIFRGFHRVLKNVDGCLEPGPLEGGTTING